MDEHVAWRRGDVEILLQPPKRKDDQGHPAHVAHATVTPKAPMWYMTPLAVVGAMEAVL
jgi:hypothetical protein